MTRMLHQSGSSKVLTVGELKPGVDRFGFGSFLSWYIVFKQRIAAGDDYAFNTTDNAVGQDGVCATVALDEHGLVVVNVLDNSQTVRGECTCRFLLGRQSHRPLPTRS